MVMHDDHNDVWENLIMGCVYREQIAIIIIVNNNMADFQFGMDLTT